MESDIRWHKPETIYNHNDYGKKIKDKHKRYPVERLVIRKPVM